MPFETIVQALQRSILGSRSTVLSDLRWLLGIVAIIFGIALRYQAPLWALVTVCVVLCIAFALYCAAYVFFSFKDPAALRSEKFGLSKLAIEKSVTGDNVAGFIDPSVRSVLLPPSETPENHE